MREIITIEIGKCGIKIGESFWQILCEEHGINPVGVFEGVSELQLTRLNVFFNESSTGHYCPRALNIDLDPTDTRSITCYGQIFNPSNTLRGGTSGSNNWGTGYLTEGAELTARTLEMIRKEVESCDLLQGFQVAHSVGGGTGGGVTSAVLEQLQPEFGNKIFFTTTVLPTPKLSDIVVEPYSSVLTLDKLVENATGVMTLDNEGLYDICYRRLKIRNPSYADLNSLISNAICGVSCSLRFPGQMNSDLRKLHVNLVPFNRMHFFLASTAPLMAKAEKNFNATDVATLTRSVFDPTAVFTGLNLAKGRYFCCSAIYRGRISTKQAENALREITSAASNNFIDWIPDNLQTTYCDLPGRSFPISCTLLANNTAVRSVISRILSQYRKLFQKKAFLHWFYGEGMEELDFREAESNLLDLVNEYQQYETLPA